MVAKHNPIKDRPLRQAGQSLDAEILEKAFDGFGVHYLLLAFVSMFLLIDWIYWLQDSPRQPWILTIICIPIFIYSPYRMWRTKQELVPLKLGRDGEKVVGEFLELFREDGARVFHDLIGDKFNVDHVLICAQGVFVIETKTYSKPHDGRIIFDGKKILRDGYNTEGKLLTQARAEANWVRRIIKESTGKTILVEPVIVFPGWFVETTQAGKSSDVTVINPRMLKQHIGQYPSVLSKEDLMLVSYHISRFIRAGG